MQDVAYAARRLRQSPGFTLGAVAVLALGVGVNLAEFHIFNAVLFPKISVRDVETLRRFSRHSKFGDWGTFSHPSTAFYRENNTTLSAIITETFSGTITLEEDSTSLSAAFVSGNYFTELGATPAYGRLLDENDVKSGAPPVVVLSYAYWQRQFGSDPKVVGRVVRLNGRPVQVVGVASYDFTGLRISQLTLWIPVTVYPFLNANRGLLDDFSEGPTVMYGRIKSGVPNSAVEQQFTSLAEELQKQHPQIIKPGQRIQSDLLTATPFDTKAVAAGAPFIVLILLILVSACVNLGNMLLTRGVTREREIGIRLAVGAGRWRLIRQLMTENLLLATIGAIAGFLVGQGAARVLLVMLEAPTGIRIVTDWRILLVGVVLTVFSALIFGLTPAIQTVGRGPKMTRARRVLVGAQVATSCVLLIVGTLLTREIVRVLTVDLQFDYKHVVVVEPQFYARRMKAPEIKQNLAEHLSRMKLLPGVDGVTVATGAPLGRGVRISKVTDGSNFWLNNIDPSYFSVLRIPIVKGRTFLPNEQNVVIVSEPAVRAMWPNEDPLGKVCEFSSRKWTVVGVVRDSGAIPGGAASMLEAYVPFEDRDMEAATIILHTDRDPAPLAVAARAVVAAPGMASTAWLMQARLDQRSDAVRRAMTVVGSLGAVATLLAAIGIFGLVSFAVSQRTKEIGVRMALGARSRNILWAVLSQYFMPVGVGTIAGIVGAFVFFKILKNQMVGLTVIDPVNYVGGIAIFGVIAFLSALVPAARALRIDPSSALRSE